MTTTSEPRNAKASYDARRDQIVVRFAHNAEIRVPVEAFPDAAESTDEIRATVHVSPDGKSIRWDALDADYYWPYLIAALLGPDEWQRASASALGSIRSAAKVRAARANGAKGGRPRKRRLRQRRGPTAT